MRSLKNEGVKTIFGYPGGAIMPVFDALYDYTRGEKKAFDHILVRHEQAAAHAAEGFSRVSGEVGVCLVTSGPGVTNTLTGVADAMIDSTPIVVIAGQVGVSALGTDAFQEVDLVGLAQPISKWSYQIRRPEDIAWAISRAFYIARTGRPGPVVIDFPKSAQVSTCEWQPAKVTSVRSYDPYPKIQDDHVAAAAQLINNAKRPLALVGHGVELGGAQNELVEFLEKADIPAARTLLGLSALPSDHPLNVGMLGMHGSYAPNVMTQQADVIIAIGMRFSDRVTGRLDTYAKQAKIIHLDIDNVEIDKNVKTDVSVVGDCKMSLPAITRLLNKNEHTEWIEGFKPYLQQETEKVIEPAIHPKEGPLLMGEVVNAVAEATDGEAVLVNDVGQNQMFLPLLQVQAQAECSHKWRTRHNGIRTSCSRRSNIRCSRPHCLPLHRRRWLPDEHSGTWHHHGAAGTGQGNTDEQQLPGQRAPVAGHVLQPSPVVHQDAQSRLSSDMQRLSSQLRCSD